MDGWRNARMKDNLIDEEKAKKEEAAQESLEQKLQRIGTFVMSCITFQIKQLIFMIQITIWKIF